jgi:ribonuclease BN (tRNA processing enzyme)
MELTVVGCDGSWPGPGGTGSCYLVQHDGFDLVLDLGGGALGRLQEHIAISDIGAIAISHPHPDHYTDLLQLSIALHWGAHGSTAVPLFVPEGFFAHISGALIPGTREAWEEAFEMREVLDRDEFNVGPFSVLASGTPHTDSSVGFRISAGGRALAYTGDTGPGETAVELARGADLLLSEATHVDGDELDFHLTARQAAAYATEAGVDRLVLTHLEPGVDPVRSLAEAREAFAGEITVASPGLRFAI